MTKTERVRLARRARRELKLYIDSLQPYMAEKIIDAGWPSVAEYRKSCLKEANEAWYRLSIGEAES